MVAILRGSEDILELDFLVVRKLRRYPRNGFGYFETNESSAIYMSLLENQRYT